MSAESGAIAPSPPAPPRARKGRFAPRLSALDAVALLLSLTLVIPIASVCFSLLSGESAVFVHLAETVLLVTGSSARMAAECKDRPVDAAIVGIVDTVQLDSQHQAELAGARRK